MNKVTRLFDLLELYKTDFHDKLDVFASKQNGQWTLYSAQDYIDYANKLALGFLSLGITKGDRVATIMVNCPEWNFIDMALFQIGAIQLPVYPNISEQNYKFILNDAKVSCIIISNAFIYKRIKNIVPTIEGLKEVFSIENIPGVINWTELLVMGEEEEYVDPGRLEKIKSGITTEDVATMIYTSGTTGFPKGAMLTHSNIISNYQACSTIPNYERDDRVLSFLPLCHIYERMLNYLFQSFGMSIYYAESIDKVGANIKEVKPHTFCAVPRVLEKTYEKIVNTGRNLKGIKKFLFFWALGLGQRFELHSANGRWYEFKLKIADMLIFRKWRQALGNNIKLIVSGGAPLQPRIARVFWAAKIKIMEGYGLTETSPVIAVTSLEPDGFKFGTCGPVLPGVEVKIAGDGEILTRGPGVMKGYFNRPEETKAIIDKDGWFHTGDIGYFEEGRYLKITDRKKEIFKTSGGKYVAPQVIENKFKESSFIENLMVIGENRNHCIALILPNFDYLQSWCRVKGIEYKGREEAILDQAIIERIKREVNDFNAAMDKVEQIRKFALIPDEWSVETGEFSPTLKLRRKYLLDKYSGLIEDIYSKNVDN